MAKGIGVYSKSEPDERDRIKPDRTVDKISGNPVAKRRQISEETMVQSADRGPLRGVKG